MIHRPPSAPARVSALLACIALVLAVLLAPGLARAAEASDSHAFAERAADAFTLVDRELDDIGNAATARRVAEEVSRLLPPSETVTVDGREVDVDDSVANSLATSLGRADTAEQRKSAGRKLHEHLASLSSAVPLRQPGPGPVSGDPAVLRKLVRERVSTSDEDLTRRVSEWIGALIDRILEALLRGADSAGGSTTLQIVYYGLIILSVLLLAYVVWRLVRRLRASVSLPDTRPAADVSQPVVAAAEGLPLDALAYAEELAAAGRHRDAVRALFGGAARRLVEADVIAHTRTRTDGELLADVRAASPEVHGPLASLTAQFERAWYGHSDPGAEGFAEASARYREVLSAVDGRGAA